MSAEMQKRHANLYHGISREKFLAAVADLDARIPSLQRNEIIVGLMRIAAMVGDGHTRVDPRKDMKFGFPSLPLRLYLFEDGLYVRAAAPEHALLVGAKIESIGDVPVEEALRRVKEICSVDNPMGYKLLAPIFLNRPDILHALKMSPRHDTATLKLRKDERTWEETVAAGAIEPRWPDDTDGSFITPEGWVDARSTPQPPMWLQAPLEYHRMIELPEHKALYAQLNMVTDVKGESLAQFGQKIRKQVEATNPRAVIFDYRLSFGGNHDLRFSYLRELIKIEDADTRVFVLTARGSFSATEALLVDLDRFTKAVFIGEPASSKPNSYGDGYRTALPNSGISVQSSIYWNQLSSARNKDPWTWVDVAVPLTFADYANGRDPALTAALDYKPEVPLIDRLVEAAKAGGRPGVREVVSRYKNDVANRYANLGVSIPQAAEGLFARNHPEEAIAVAKEAVKDFPDSVDAWIVLAYIASKTGQHDLAQQAGEGTLQLDPNNRNVRKYMESSQVPGK
jgi:tetratricopeptide (TPR) repeat protein